jgi:hypothetical protein
VGSLSHCHRLAGWATGFLGVGAALSAATPASWVSDQARPGDFALVSSSGAADVVYAAEDFKVVAIAARDFAADVERVAGRRPVVRTDVPAVEASAVLAGTLGRSPLIDGLVRAGKLDVGALRGQWESFVIATVPNPLPGVAQGLVVAGSDRRGTAYGLYELSQAIGVSPWYWWADVAPAKMAELHVAAGTRRYGPPSVKYRGIFLNDEDWGLQPWAAKTFAPGEGGIGPKVYAKVFELLLRLKANTLWPAMHGCTKPFNSFPEDARLADEYGIVMGSSHAEPMLRNNVGEWTAPPEEYNYVTNRTGVLRYWEEHVAANGRFDNIYTLGMRGIHDSPMVGPKTDPERIRTLEQIFADQRALLAKYVNPDVMQVPQAFTPYKEVLPLYRQGLQVPDDVTIVWPDDNFGYIRQFPTPAEQKRAGGFGVYYHISYLGSPMAYLWLCTTPPALIWEEMSKAYDHGADRIWIVNVGDLKPGEIGAEFFLQMAWDIHRWRRNNLPEFLGEWATRAFGPEQAREIAGIMADYYRLNDQRKPEHLQWWLPGQPPRPSPFTPEEIHQRLEAFAWLRAQVDRLAAVLPAADHDAFYELVVYPVRGAALANERYFCGELAAFHAAAGLADAAELSARATVADAQLKEETRDFNERLAGGKWRHILALEPADGQWRSFRIAPWALPKFASAAKSPEISAGPAAAAPAHGGLVETNGVVSIEAGHYTGKADRGGAGWAPVPGLGRTGDAVAVFPTTMRSVPPEKLAADAPRLDYEIDFVSAGEFTVNVNLVPTHPLAGNRLRFAVGLDDTPPQLVEFDVMDGGAEWAQDVLDATRVAVAKLTVPTGGPHTLHIYAVDAGVVLDKIIIDCGGLKPSYLGPPESRAP